ncbi:MAG TPA: CHAT domain-containing protein, partial [Candidatus Obscuribacterales bacterium]
MTNLEMASQMLSRFRSRSKFTDLLTAIDVLLKGARGDGTPDTKGAILLELGRALISRYKLGHQVEDLKGAESALEYGLSLTSPDSGLWSDLSEYLSRVYSNAVAEGGEGRIMFGIGKARNQMRSLAVAALNTTDRTSPLYPSRLYTLAHSDLVACLDDIAYLGSDQELQTSLLERALNNLEEALRLQPGSELRSMIYFDKALCLSVQMAIAPEHNPPVINVVNSLRHSLNAAIQSEDQLLVLKSAEYLGRSLAAIEQWHDSANAYRLALVTARAILSEQDSLLDREPWLNQMPRLGSYAAYALAKGAAPEEAIQALELFRGHWGFEESIPNIRLKEIYTLLHEHQSGIAYLACTPIGSVAISVTLDRNKFPRIEADFVDALDEAKVDAVLGIQSGALRVGARPREATPWELLRAFVGDTAADIGHPPSSAAHHSVLRTLHAFFGIKPGTFLRGYLSVVGKERDNKESDEAALRRYISTINACCELMGPLMTPVAQALRTAGIQQVLLIPDSKIGLLPLHASLVTLDDERGYFCDLYETSVLNSAKAQYLITRRESLSGIGKGSKAIFVVANTLAEDPDQALPWSEVEMSWITDAFPDGAVTSISRGGSIGEIVQGIENSDISHLACHGTFDPDYPWRSGIELANARLTVGDMLSGQIFEDHRLVVFSACQTAVTDFKRLPEDMFGLPMSAIFSGAKNCIGTMWPVNDLPTALF